MGLISMDAASITFELSALEAYLDRTELIPAPTETDARAYMDELGAWLAERIEAPVERLAVEKMLSYKVPEMTPDGCSRLDGALAATPYNLANTLGVEISEIENTALGRRLWLLDGLVEKVCKDTGVDWLGFYQRRQLPSGEALVKIAYRGIESRAEFPLTKEFARGSNNSSVGLSGQPVIINDIEQYLWEQGGPYYQCDGKVHSEACMPVFGVGSSETIGILDAEDHNREKFGMAEIAKLTATAVILEKLLDLP